jgi:hypothetical protein
MPAGRLHGPWHTPEVIPTTLAPETGEVSWVCMGLWWVPFLAEVMSVSIKVLGFFVWPRDCCPRGQVSWSVVSRLGTYRLLDRSGWRLLHGHLLVSGSLGLPPSGSRPKRHLSMHHSIMSNRLWPHDPLWQPRQLPDLCAVVVHDERASCQLIVGEIRN